MTPILTRTGKAAGDTLWVEAGRLLRWERRDQVNRWTHAMREGSMRDLMGAMGACCTSVLINNNGNALITLFLHAAIIFFTAACNTIVPCRMLATLLPLGPMQYIASFVNVYAHLLYRHISGGMARPRPLYPCCCLRFKWPPWAGPSSAGSPP